MLKVFFIVLKKEKKNITEIDRLQGKLNVAQFSYVLHNLHGQFSHFQVFILLLEIFKKFANLYCGGIFAQRKRAL